MGVSTIVDYSINKHIVYFKQPPPIANFRIIQNAPRGGSLLAFHARSPHDRVPGRLLVYRDYLTGKISVVYDNFDQAPYIVGRSGDP